MKKHYWYLISICISSLVFWRWFSFKIFAAGDYTYYYTETLRSWILPSTWSYKGFGQPQLLLWKYPYNFLFGILASVNLPFEVIDKLLLIFPICLLSVAVSFWFVNIFVENKIAALIGSLFIFINTYYLSIATQGHLNLHFSALFGLLALGTFIKACNKSSVDILSLIFLLISGFIDFRVSYIVGMLIFLYTAINVFEYFLSKRGQITLFEIIQRVRLFIYVFFLFIICNLFWLLPQFFSGSITSNSILSRGLFGNEFFNITESLSVFFPFWNGSEPVWFQIQNIFPIYFLIPIIAWAGFIITPKNKKNNFYRINNINRYLFI